MGKQSRSRLSLGVFDSINVIIFDNEVFYVYAFTPGKALGRFRRFTVFKCDVHSRAFKFFRAVCLGFFHTAHQYGQTAGCTQNCYIGKGNPCILQFFQGQFLKIF